MTGTRTYSRFMYSQNRLHMNIIPHSSRPPAYSTCRMGTPPPLIPTASASSKHTTQTQASRSSERSRQRLHRCPMSGRSSSSRASSSHTHTHTHEQDRNDRLGLPMVVCVECLPADKPWDMVSATSWSSGVAPRACVRVYARVLVPPHL